MRLHSTMPLCFAAILLAGPAGADEKPTQDEILAAVRSGEMRALSDIEQEVKDRLPGTTIKVELERKKGVWIYEFKTLDAAGRRSNVHVDARTGVILKQERK